jgi:hypothetical protein
MGKIIGLDVSTKTIGISLIDSNNGKLYELTHITPKIKPLPKNNLETLFKKAECFKDFIERYIDADVDYVVIEEPLLSSNNSYTVATLLRYNGIISKITYDVLGILPTFISSYESRKNAFPELMEKRKFNKKGEKLSDKNIERNEPVLFGGYPFDIDKKMVVWEKVSEKEPQVKWSYDKHGFLSKECFDMSDAYTCGLAFFNIKKIIEKERII